MKQSYIAHQDVNNKKKFHNVLYIKNKKKILDIYAIVGFINTPPPKKH